MPLAAYSACTRSQKQALLQSFWSRTSQPDALVARVSLEYGPVAFWMILVTTIEQIVLVVGLVGHHQTLRAGLASAATLFSGWSTWWNWRCISWARHNNAILERFP